MSLKTRIVCTLGPSTDDLDMLKKMLQAGMTAARFNFSHGTYEEHAERIKLLRKAEKETGIDVTLILDTAGPEIRTGPIKDGEVRLKEGQEFILTTREVDGDATKVTVSYDLLPSCVKPGQNILVDDGLIRLETISVDGDEIKCRVMNGGKLTKRRGVNVPGADLPFPVLTEKDREDLAFGVKQKMDVIAASFVRNAEDVRTIRARLAELKGRQAIISKIETKQGWDNMHDILQLSDGLMVARGDLGVEVPPEELPVMQKEMIRACNQAGKPVITATQMLESMIHNPRPTRAEASDVANAILDGTDAIMLSGETAAGEYPYEAVATMAKIAGQIEKSDIWKQRFARNVNELEDVRDPISDSVARAACMLAEKIQAKAILTSTQAGFTARQISRFRPRSQIVATTPVETVRRQLLLSWGIIPLLVTSEKNTDDVIATAIETAMNAGQVAKGDLVVITAGVPVGRTGSTNLIKVHRIGDALR
jgi:pyruvate kinase